jgi:hypothetical protein
MDRRKIYLDQQQTFYESLNNKDLNLEIAKNIELMVDLKEVIRMKAIQSYDEGRENSKVLTISHSHSSLDDKPKLIYILFFVSWFMLYRRQMVGKLSFLWGIVGLGIILNISNKGNLYRKAALLQNSKRIWGL